jgi:hypothetical protein
MNSTSAALRNPGIQKTLNCPVISGTCVATDDNRVIPALMPVVGFGVSAMYTGIAGALGRCCRPMSPRAASPSCFRTNSWSAASVVGSSRFRVSLSGRFSSSSRTMSRIRYRRRRPMSLVIGMFLIALMYLMLSGPSTSSASSFDDWQSPRGKN